MSQIGSKPWENTSYDVSETLGLLAMRSGAPVGYWVFGLSEAIQVRIGTISGPTPKILIIRLRL
jgi:hypothetical protein